MKSAMFSTHDFESVEFDLARLLTLDNVIITSHMGFLTREALKEFAETTLGSLSAFSRNEPLTNEIRQGT